MKTARRSVDKRTPFSFARSRASVGVLTLLAFASAGPAPAQRLDLTTAKGLALHNVAAEPVTFEARPALRVTISAEAKTIYDRQAAATPVPPGASAPPASSHLELLAVVEGVEFTNGTIEVDLAGEPGSGGGAGARGFVGVAFRVSADRQTYDAFYLRPTNGRADDQVRRNHSAQYISHPDWPWFRLRQESPERYESYVDIQPGAWIHVKIEVDGARARLYVNGAEQPTLVVSDVKTGASGKGGVGLWIEGSTVAHFANLVITKK